MSQDPIITSESKRNIWVRGLYMLLMALAYQISGTLVLIVAIFQFLVTLISDTPNTRLLLFGCNLGRYFQQIVNFLTFASEVVPFPFSDWPSGD
jgi:hypothetical protein